MDELGFVPLRPRRRRTAFSLLAQPYERQSTVITAHFAFSKSVKVFDDETDTPRLLDRLTHHSHILTTRRESYGTAQSWSADRGTLARTGNL